MGMAIAALIVATIGFGLVVGADRDDRACSSSRLAILAILLLGSFWPSRAEAGRL